MVRDGSQWPRAYWFFIIESHSDAEINLFCIFFELVAKVRNMILKKIEVLTFFCVNVRISNENPVPKRTDQPL